MSSEHPQTTTLLPDVAGAPTVAHRRPAPTHVTTEHAHHAPTPSRAFPRRARGRGGPRPSAALALILVVGFMVVLDFSIVNVALAAIERELHAGATAVQWVITAYAITFGGLLVLGGRLGDLFGRRRMFVAGLVLFSVASLAGGLAGNLGVLVAARAVQGVGAAILAPAALSLITTTTEEGPARTRALGLYGATASIGFVAGLVLGGLLVQFFDWRAVLWVNVPIGLAAAALAPLLIPPASPARRVARTDVGGALLVTAAIAAVVYGVSEGPISGWLSGRTLGALGLAALLGWAFVAVERRHPAPLVRLGLLRLRPLRNANLMTVVIGAWSAGELLVLPLYLQLVLHYSPLLAGLAIAPQGVVGFLGAAQGARLLRRLGTRRFLALSAASATTGMALLGIFLAARSYPLLLAGFVFAGYGTATGAFGTTVLATQGVGNGEQGLAGGLVNMSRQVGAAVGVAVAAAIIGGGMAGGTAVGSDRAAVLTAAAAAALAVVLAARGLAASDGRRRAGRRSQERAVRREAVPNTATCGGEERAVRRTSGICAGRPRSFAPFEALGMPSRLPPR